MTGVQEQKGAKQKALGWASHPAPVTCVLVWARFNQDLVFLMPWGPAG